MPGTTQPIATLLIASALLACARGDANLPPGYTLAPQATALPSNTTDASAPHTATIRRSFDDATEERLLRIAESVYPPRAAVEEAARGGFRNASAPDPDEPLWWHGEFDGVRLPYAITAEAVAYYWDLHRRFEAGDSLAAGPIAMHTSAFTYEADVGREASVELNGARYDDVYVVRMRMGWSNVCGDLCALSVGKARTVVLTADGRVLAVDGDEVSPIVVS